MLIHQVVQDAATFRLDETAQGHAGVDGHSETLLSQTDFDLSSVSKPAASSTLAVDHRRPDAESTCPLVFNV